jgi:hypothetical protein
MNMDKKYGIIATIFLVSTIYLSYRNYSFMKKYIKIIHEEFTRTYDDDDYESDYESDNDQLISLKW